MKKNMDNFAQYLEKIDYDYSPIID